MAPVLSESLELELGEDGGGSDGGGGDGDGGGLGGGGATLMATVCVVCATVGLTDATVTPAGARAVVRSDVLLLAKVWALLATLAAVDASEVGTIIWACTLMLPAESVKAISQGA